MIRRSDSGYLDSVLGVAANGVVENDRLSETAVNSNAGCRIADVFVSS